MLVKVVLRNLTRNRALQDHLRSIWHAYKWSLQRVYFFFFHPDVRLCRRAENMEQPGEFRSQFGQDRVLASVFKGKRNGSFLDIGANHPEHLSNSYYFEKELDWQGIAVDPLPDKEPLWQRLRPNTKFVNALVSDRFGEVELVHVTGPDGWEDMLSTVSHNATSEQLSRPHVRTNVECVTANYLLDGALLESLDFVSIDVEGSELAVLRGFDLSRYRPKVVLLENTLRIVGSEQLRRYLHERGYFFYMRIWTTDDLYLSREFRSELGDDWPVDYTPRAGKTSRTGRGG